MLSVIKQKCGTKKAHKAAKVSGCLNDLPRFLQLDMNVRIHKIIYDLITYVCSGNEGRHYKKAFRRQLK